jgi:hypothetical protein
MEINFRDGTPWLVNISVAKQEYIYLVLILRVRSVLKYLLIILFSYSESKEIAYVNKFI